MYFATAFLMSCASWFAMGSRANTIAHTTRIRHGINENDGLRGVMAKTIEMGVRMALEQCKFQFKWDRWNCPESSFATRYDNPATREMAYVSSITSAGIVHAVTRSCSRGTMPLCGCIKDFQSPHLDRQKIDADYNSVQAEWEWRGCSDDVTMGALVSKTFLSALEGASADVLSTVNLHNSRLGLSVVRGSVKPDCKCHGMSGSCTTKTCWRRVESFDKIGDKLKHRYNRALRIQMNSPRISSETPETSMVFIDDSPDYCKPNTTTSWSGTGGRLCFGGRMNNTDKAERRSCKDLCRSCGHQVKRRRVKEAWDCNCHFQWCCKVECKTCQRTVMQRYCDDRPHRY